MTGDDELGRAVRLLQEVRAMRRAFVPGAVWCRTLLELASEQPLMVKTTIDG